MGIGWVWCWREVEDGCELVMEWQAEGGVVIGLVGTKDGYGVGLDKTDRPRLPWGGGWKVWWMTGLRVGFDGMKDGGMYGIWDELNGWMWCGDPVMTGWWGLIALKRVWVAMHGQVEMGKMMGMKWVG